MTPDDEPPPSCCDLFRDGRCLACVALGALLAYAVLAVLHLFTGGAL